MKKIFAVFIIMQIGITSFGQAYVPFPTDSAQWNQMIAQYDGGPYGGMYYDNYQFFIDGDTVIDGNMYSKLFSKSTGGQGYYFGGIREDSNRNIFIYPRAEQIGMWGYEFPNDTSEQLLYTFNNLEVGSNFTINSLDISVEAIDSIEFDGIYHKRYLVSGTKMWSGPEYWIEGIGSDHELLGIYCYFEEFERSYYTLCYSPEPGVTYYVNQPGDEDLCYYEGINDIPSEITTVTPNPVTDYLRINGSGIGKSENDHHKYCRTGCKASIF